MIQFKPPAQRPLAAPDLLVRNVQNTIIAAILWAQLIKAKGLHPSLQRALLPFFPLLPSVNHLVGYSVE